MISHCLDKVEPKEIFLNHSIDPSTKSKDSNKVSFFNLRVLTGYVKKSRIYNNSWKRILKLHEFKTLRVDILFLFRNTIAVLFFFEGMLISSWYQKYIF